MLFLCCISSYLLLKKNRGGGEKDAIRVNATLSKTIFMVVSKAPAIAHNT